jgi:hypothetical protein
MKTTVHRLVLPFLALGLTLAACGGRGLENPPPGDGGGPGSCNDRGTVHANGTSWACSGGCSTCSCEDGVIASTSIGCEPPPPPQPCVVFDGDGGTATYASGQSWTNGPCDGQCTCNDGAVICADVACVMCFDSNLSHPVGSTWLCSDGCGTCTCLSNGEISRTSICDEGGPPPLRDAGQDANDASVPGPDANDASIPGQCGAGEYLCACAGGSYCLADFAACIAPTAPCPCQTAADCAGPLPAVCAICADGGDGCAHFVCVGGACETAFCE